MIVYSVDEVAGLIEENEVPDALAGDGAAIDRFLAQEIDDMLSEVEESERAGARRYRGRFGRGKVAAFYWMADPSSDPAPAREWAEQDWSMKEGTR